MIVTAEEGKRYGGISAVLAEKLLPGTEVFNKTVYGLADQRAASSLKWLKMVISPFLLI